MTRRKFLAGLLGGALALLVPWRWRIGVSRRPHIRVVGDPAFVRDVRRALALLGRVTFLDFVESVVREVRQGVVAGNPRILGAWWPEGEHTVTLNTRWARDKMGARILVHEAAHGMLEELGLRGVGKLGETRAEVVAAAMLFGLGEIPYARGTTRRIGDIPEGDPVSEGRQEKGWPPVELCSVEGR